LILTYVTNPIIIDGLSKININILNIISIIIFTIFIIDNIISTIIIVGFRKTTIIVGKEEKQDNTEQITQRVRQILSQKSWGYKRLIDAFPKLKTIRNKIQEITYEVKENAKEIKENINEKAGDIKNTISDKKREVKTTLKLNKRRLKHKWIENKK